MISRMVMMPPPPLTHSFKVVERRVRTFDFKKYLGHDILTDDDDVEGGEGHEEELPGGWVGGTVLQSPRPGGWGWVGGE